jgi:hypothetical protein
MFIDPFLVARQNRAEGFRIRPVHRTGGKSTENSP